MTASPSVRPPAAPPEDPFAWLRLAAASVSAGVVCGGVVTLFRLLLSRADRWRTEGLAAAASAGIGGSLLAVVLLAAAAALAAWMVRRWAPGAAGSGIPQVESVLAGTAPALPFSVLPVKFAGGLLAIGGGLALGREGPSVQMGAGIGEWFARGFRLPRADALAVFAAGGGAGLATAFNAPIAGAVLVLEELVRRYDSRTALAALGASGGAIAVSRIFLGQAPDFQVPSIPYSGVAGGVGFLVLGIAAGVAAVAYHRLLLRTLALADRIRRVPVEARAALVGVAVAGLGLWQPSWIGGGDPLTQAAVSGETPISILPILLLVRLGLSVVSYAAGTPGGLFAPMLVLGSQMGLLVGAGLTALDPSMSTPATAYAVVGMAALFAGVVRAPATALILVTELTGNVTLLLPMLAAGFVAMLIPSLAGLPGIYDALRDRQNGAPSPVSRDPDAV